MVNGRMDVCWMDGCLTDSWMLDGCICNGWMFKWWMIENICRRSRCSRWWSCHLQQLAPHADSSVGDFSWQDEEQVIWGQPQDAGLGQLGDGAHHSWTQNISSWLRSCCYLQPLFTRHMNPVWNLGSLQFTAAAIRHIPELSLQLNPGSDPAQSSWADHVEHLGPWSLSKEAQLTAELTNENHMKPLLSH